MRQRIIITQALVVLMLTVGVTQALLMPNPNVPRRERKLRELAAQRRKMSLQQGPPQQGGGGDAPGGSTSSGETTATTCTVSSGTCAADGSSNYVSRSLTWNGTTGKFSGTMTSNLCSNNAYGIVPQTGEDASMSHTADCTEQTFPAPDFTTAPTAAPTLGRVGLSLYGVNMYGPFEAGFTLGQACTNDLGDCAGGVDIGACEAELKYECGESNVDYTLLMDTCGGHANPYHFHTEMLCDESNNAAFTGNNTQEHAPLVGIALDGHGIYGPYESGTTEPTDLDACGGHYGPVPSSNMSGVSHTGGWVYHYHAQKNPPYLIGCYGPVSSVTECRGLFTECGSTISITKEDGSTTDYDDYCPCFDSTGSNVDGVTNTPTPDLILSTSSGAAGLVAPVMLAISVVISAVL